MAMFPSERLKGITPFVVAADTGSFIAAAARLNVTGSAVSKSVARLEGRLGIALFERTTRSLQLTDAGRAFYETCSRVLRELAEAEAVLAAQKTEPVGRLCIGLPASFGRVRVMPILLDVFAKYPDLQPRIFFTDRFVDLVDEGIDLAVRIGGAGVLPASLGHRHLGCERLIFCAAPAYLKRRGIPQKAEDLDQHECIAYGRHDAMASPFSFLAESGRGDRRLFSPRIVVGDGEALLASVRAGLGIAQVATWLALDDLKSGKVVEVMGELAVDGLPLHLVWPVARQLTPKVDVLLQALERNLRIR